VIDNEDLWNDKLALIEQLIQIKHAKKLLKERKEEKEKGGHIVNPIDVHYNKLKCILTPLEGESEELAVVRRYVENTHAPTHTDYTLKLMDVISIDREGERERFKDFEEKKVNRMLLWHGSRLTNFVGILSQGLRIAPPEAPVTGYMFGKGVYFADMVSKSANYCNTSRNSPIGLLLLCEVAVGDSNLLYHADYNASILPDGKLSTMGCGKMVPDPTGFQYLSNGCVVPSGKPKKITLPQDGDLLYNEFIVYNTSQCKMRYLVKVQFKYANSFI